MTAEEAYRRLEAALRRYYQPITLEEYQRRHGPVPALLVELAKPIQR